MYCEKCGTKIKEEAGFCQSCGSAISSTHADSAHGLVRKNASIPLTQEDYSRKKIWAFVLPIAVFIGSLLLWGVVNVAVSQGAFSDIVNALLPLIIGITVFWIPLGILVALYFHRRQKQELLTQYDKRSGLNKDSTVPEEVKKWNWGAFGLTVIWGAYHGVWSSFFVFIPIVNIVYIFILGANGSELAWRKNKWGSVEEFRKSQRKWNIAGIITLLISISFGILSSMI